MSEPLWTLSDVSLGRRRRRLDGVSLLIRAGVTAVIGPSGAGKTSLLNLLVEYETPDAGRLTRTIPGSDRRLPIAWVPSDFGLWPHLNVRQHLEVAQAADDSRGESKGPSVEALLQGFHLLDLEGAAVGRLSQGERSRLALARALAADPAVLVLDEPLVHVDPVHVDEYWQVLRDQCLRQQTSMIFSTHDPDVVLRQAERAVCLDGGRVVFEGEVDDLYHRPPTQRLSRFLGPGNWFEHGTAAEWIADHPAGAPNLCVRPEHLDVAPAAASPLVVESSQAGPLVTATRLKDERNQQVRFVYHRTADPPLAVGTRVLLRLCCALLMLLATAACQQSAAAPALTMEAFRTLRLPVDKASIPAPRSVAVSPGGEVYVLDKAGRVLVYDRTGKFDRSWWMPEHEIGKPEGVCILEDGRVVVADTHYHRIVIFDGNGTVLEMFGELGEGPGQFIYPVSVTRDPEGYLYVAEYGGNDRIQKFTPEGEWVLTIGSFGTAAGQFQRPSGIVWRTHDQEGPPVEGTGGDPSHAGNAGSGTLFVADAINNRVQAFADDGTFLGVIAGWQGTSARVGSDPSRDADSPSPEESSSPSGISLEYPYDIALGPEGNLYVVEYAAGRVTALTPQGELLGTYGQSGRENGQFWTPWGIAVGPDGRIFVADTGNKRIVELTP